MKSLSRSEDDPGAEAAAVAGPIDGAPGAVVVVVVAVVVVAVVVVVASVEEASADAGSRSPRIVDSWSKRALRG